MDKETMCIARLATREHLKGMGVVTNVKKGGIRMSLASGNAKANRYVQVNML
jgi:hypothetical protein